MSSIPTISMIAGMANNRVIGHQNQLPWHLPADLAWFKKTTLGKPIIMGRKTYESIGKPLPGRQNIVITSNEALELPGCDVVTSPDAALDCAGDNSEVMVIGGALVYELFLPHSQRLYLTLVDAEIEGDAFFPDYHAAADWAVVFEENHPVDDRHKYAFTFQQLERKS